LESHPRQPFYPSSLHCLLDPFAAKAQQILCSRSVASASCPGKDARGKVCGPTISILSCLLRGNPPPSTLRVINQVSRTLVEHPNLGTTLNHDILCRQTSAWSTEFGPYREQGTGGQVTVGDVIRVQGLGNPVRAASISTPFSSSSPNLSLPPSLPFLCLSRACGFGLEIQSPHSNSLTLSPETPKPLNQVLEYGDGHSDIIKALVTSVDTSRQTWVGQSTLLHQYAAPNNMSTPWNVVFSGCCRSDDLDFLAAGSNFNVLTNVSF
jgi:hypothetical protein